MPAASADSSSSPAERFALTGPSVTLDPRIHAYRGDIADIALAGQLIAPHYARPLMRTAVTAAEVRARPTDDAELVCSLAIGEEFAMLDIVGDWAWGYCRTGHKVGYVRVAHLTG